MAMIIILCALHLVVGGKIAEVMRGRNI